MGQGEPMSEEEPQGEELEGIRLHVETPLRVLKGLCDQLGLSHSGRKNKVLKRLKEHHEVLSRQMSAEIARKMFQESERVADVPKLPRLPTPAQQALHNVTHHPLLPLGRSRQKPDEPIEEARKIPKIEIDCAVTFTKHRHEIQAGEGKSINEREAGVDADDAAQAADS